MISAQDMMRQAGMTADTYLRDAVESIDNLFGDGYARAHPQLVGQFMRVAVADYAAVSVSDPNESLATAVSDIALALANIADAIDRMGSPVIPRSRTAA